MTNISTLFYNSDTQITETLYKKITLSDEQYNEQMNYWNDLADYLKSNLKAESDLTISSWLQGSYKFKTQIRPTNPREEFDIDLGIYFEVDKKPTEEKFSPKNLKDMIQKFLISYSRLNNTETLKVDNPAKERCARIHFPGNFHIDVPCYYKIPSTKKTELATESNVWENSDPEAFYNWFQNSFDDTEREIARRIIKYIKCWSGITFIDQKKNAKPSSILLMVLVTQALLDLPKDTFKCHDDEVLSAVLTKIIQRLQNLSKVNNPVNKEECLSDRVEEFDVFISELKSFAKIASDALNCSRAIDALSKWQLAFHHFIPMIDEEEVTKSISNSLVPYGFDPIIKISATSNDNNSINYSGINKIGPIPKNCSIAFHISNESQIPAGSLIQWSVRNFGSDSEYVNDIGHLAGNSTSVTRNSAYNGTHYMDCLITHNNKTIGFKRALVEIKGPAIPKRNPPKPNWVKFRNKN